ncbi:MAG: hypothetical protein ISR73_04875 [Gammaproteobacteria bacterium]|nr:hypothetical protein [Gammaproteobacteria bacterium]
MALSKDALMAGLISIVIVILLNALLLIAALSLLSDLIPPALLYALLKGLSIFSLAIPAYIAARATRHNYLLHSLLTGAVESVLLLLMMTQTFSWEGTLQNEIMRQMPLVVVVVMSLSLLAGLLAKRLNQREDA